MHEIVLFVPFRRSVPFRILYRPTSDSSRHQPSVYTDEAASVHPGTYLEGGRIGALPSLNPANVGLHIRSPVFETAQREAFCDVWKALKSVFCPGSPLDPAAACSRRSPDLSSVGN